MPTIEKQIERTRKELLAYRRAIDASSIVAITDHHGVITYVNENFCRISQYSSEELIGHTHSIINSGYHGREFFRELWATISSGEIWKGEIRNRAKDGTFYWVDTTIVPFIGDEGRPHQYMSIRTDITAIKEARDRKYRLLFDNSHDGLMLWRSSGIMQEVNEAMCQMLGYSYDEMRTLSRKDLVVPDAYLAEGLRIREETGHYEGPLRYMRKDGTILDADVSSANYHDELGRGYTLVAVRDMTEKLKAERELRISEMKYRALIENSKDGIALTDKDRNIIYVSPSIKDILRYTPEELIGANLHEYMHPDERHKTREAVNAIIGNSEKPYLSDVTRSRHKDGSWRWIEATVSDQLENPAINAIVSNFRDVTERILAQEKLRDNEIYFRTLIENNKDGIMLSTPERIVKYMSPAIKNILGYEPEELIGRDATFIWHPEESSENIERRTQLAPGESVTAVVRALHKNGTWRLIEANITNRINDPVINGMLTNFRDVTEKAEAEKRIREQDMRYKTLIENNKDVIALSGWNRKIRYLSPAIREVLGYEPEELIGQLSERLMHPDEVEAVFAGISRLGPGESFSKQVRSVHKDGSIRILEVIWSNQMYNPSVQAIVSNFRDVSEKVEAEKKIRESEMRFRALIENNKDVIALSSGDGALVYISPATREMLGYEPEELIGTSARALMHPDELEFNAGQFEWLVKNPGKSVQKIMRMQHKNGNWRWIDATTTSQLDNPAVCALVSNLRDVTERKKAEEDLENLNQSLEQKIDERTRELKESNKALDSFTYMVAHDLQSPIRLQAGYANMMKEVYGAQLGSEGCELADVIVKSSAHMRQLVNDMLAFSKANHGVMTLENVCFDEVVREVSDECLIKENNPHVDIRIGELGYCHCDPNLIRQVWINLISNALKYSGKKEHPLIEIGTSLQDGQKVYYVHDNGAGFDNRYASKLFEAFQRLHPVGDFEGSGLGLSIVSNIIKRHGGRIWAEGEVDKGATFCFTLPE